MTLYIAIWGAAIGTLTFIWNLLKWHQEKPRIAVSVEAVKSFWSPDCFSGIRLTLRNRGGRKTTVETVFFYRRAHWNEWRWLTIFFRIRREVVWRQDIGISNSKTAMLPANLDVNGKWEGFVPLEPNDSDSEDDLRQMNRNRDLAQKLKLGNLRYAIECSHTSRRIRGLIKVEDEALRE